jgi:hypothetical protein
VCPAPGCSANQTSSNSAGEQPSYVERQVLNMAKSQSQYAAELRERARAEGLDPNSEEIEWIAFDLAHDAERAEQFWAQAPLGWFQ